MQREHFSSRMGFVLAAAGAAVGLGNIWGFPTQAASNGGGAFLFIYLLMILLVAYPMLLVELAIGRHGQANPIDSMRSLASTRFTRLLGEGVGWVGLAVPCLVLVFYSVVAGWLISSLLGSMAQLVGLTVAAEWLNGFSVLRNLFGMVLFYLLTIMIVKSGVKQGIEKWSKRLMPALLALFLSLFAYILTQQGAIEGLKHYLIPDFSRVLDKDLILAAMGQGFFSLTIGGCSMLIYGSYLSKQESLPKVAMSVTLVDTGVAFLAGLVVLPAMFVAMHNGVEIYDANQQLIDSDTLVFSVLPMLFERLGVVGEVVALIFFALMTVAALTSSISMLECPVALMSERMNVARGKTSWLLGGLLCVCSAVVVFNFPALFGLVAMIATQYFQPFAALLFCLFGGWIWSRHGKLSEIAQGDAQFAQSWFGKAWTYYVKFICPVLVFTVLWVTMF